MWIHRPIGLTPCRDLLSLHPRTTDVRVCGHTFATREAMPSRSRGGYASALRRRGSAARFHSACRVRRIKLGISCSVLASPLPLHRSPPPLPLPPPHHSRGRRPGARARTRAGGSHVRPEAGPQPEHPRPRRGHPPRAPQRARRPPLQVSARAPPPATQRPRPSSLAALAGL